MTEPRTEAGKRLDSAWPGTHLDRLAWHEAIVRIEAEATAAAEQRLRTSIAEWREPEPLTDMERGWNRALDAVLALFDAPAPRETPPYHTEAYGPSPDTAHLAASPRQGEPVDLDVERLARAIEREIHVDPEHGFPPGVDSRYLANAIAGSLRPPRRTRSPGQAVSRVRALTRDEVDDLRGRTRFAEKRSAEAVLRRALRTIDEYHGAMETVAQWDAWARRWLAESLQPVAPDKEGNG